MACGMNTLEPLNEASVVGEGAEGVDGHGGSIENMEQIANQILDDIEHELEEISEMDAHWQTDPSDYGRMAVRRLSQELAFQGPQLRRMSSDLGSFSRPSHPTPAPLTRRQSDFGLTGGSGLGLKSALEKTPSPSKFKRRMSMDQSLFRGLLSEHRVSQETLWENSEGRQPTSGCIDETPERRGGISFEKTDNNALYVRMLGDVKVQTKPVISRERRRSSLLDSDLRILETLDVSQYKIRYGHKFYSLHRVKRKARSALKVTRDDAILDAHYGGQARCLLSTVGDWSFNVFNLDKLTNGRSLFHMALHIFQEYNLVDTFQLDIVKIMRCFTLIEEGYHSNNHYHNAVHAADVAQAMHCYLQESKLSSCVSPLETMIAIISALAHDLDHPGVNQTFLISTSNHLAALYKNSSVLENHHWRSAMGVIHESGIFSHLDQHTFSLIESQIRSLILATDITRQQELLGQFKKLLETNELDLHDEGHRHFTLQIALKCADICNPCRPWDISKRWSEQICDEFFQQGDFERQLQLPVTPNCDRYTTTVAKIQSGFIQFVVNPLFNEWYHFNPTPLSQMMLENMRHNKSLWDSITAKSEAEQKYACQEGCSSEEENQDPIDTTLKENININVNVHCEDVPEDVVLEDRFNSSCQSEDLLFKGCSLRRHSLPPPVISRDLQQVFPRRESLTNRRAVPSQVSHNTTNTGKSSRRHSLPVSTNSRNTAALDRLAEKLVSLAERGQRIDSISSGLDSKTAVSDILSSQRPKITNLSSDTDATIRLSSLNALLAARAAGNQGTLLAGRLTSRLKSHPAKEVTFDIACPALATKSSVLRTSSTSGIGLRPAGGGNGNNNSSRQVLKPLNTNNYQTGTKLEGTPRNRSGSDFGLRSKQLQGVLFERPRSLSLEHESQPLLRSIGEWRALSAEKDDIHDSSNVYTAQPAYTDPDLDVAMATAHVMEEEAMTMPLLGDHHNHHHHHRHSTHSTSSSHLSPS